VNDAERSVTAARAALAQRWQALGNRLGCASPARWAREGRALLRHWNFWPRRYHDLHHLAACLRHLDAVRDRLEDADAVELALWFHDAVYWPWSSRNEARSAAWAVRFLSRIGLDIDRVRQVERHVLDTRHVAPPSSGDAQWLIDIDLAILGQTPRVYAAFERQVRAEYRFIPWQRFTQRRQRILGSFLAREHLYNTPWFRERYEHQARANLARAIDALARGQLYSAPPEVPA
jgi:predicted metal-dependent HD superfamily phosphohydrolase